MVFPRLALSGQDARAPSGALTKPRRLAGQQIFLPNLLALGYYPREVAAPVASTLPDQRLFPDKVRVRTPPACKHAGRHAYRFSLGFTQGGSP